MDITTAIIITIAASAVVFCGVDFLPWSSKK